MGAQMERRQVDYKILTSNDIRQEIRSMVAHTSEVTGLSMNASRSLLRQFKWDKQLLLEKYYDQSSADARIFGAAQLIDDQCNAKSSDATTQQGTCGICGGGEEDGRLVGLQCKHLYCLDCWYHYIKCKVDASACNILCPASECTISIDNESLKRLVDSSPQLIEAFVRAEVNDYVKSDRRVKWCPGAGCERAASVLETGSQQIECECGESFCFECTREWHGPLDCDFLKKWLKQLDDNSEILQWPRHHTADSGTIKWINENTKDCPRCKAPIQKIGGCNHMVCGKCFHLFDWLSVSSGHELRSRDTQDHLGYNSDANANDETEMANAENRDKTMTDKERYVHYANRFIAQQHSHKLEKELHQAVAGKITQFQKQGFSFIEAKFLDEAVRVLSACRLSLMYTYAFAYYLDTDDNTRKLFEDTQRDLALATEALSGFLELDIGRVVDPAKLKQMVQDKCRYVQHRRDALIKWNTEGGWKLVDRTPTNKKKEEEGK